MRVIFDSYVPEGVMTIERKFGGRWGYDTQTFSFSGDYALKVLAILEMDGLANNEVEIAKIARAGNRARMRKKALLQNVAKRQQRRMT